MDSLGGAIKKLQLILIVLVLSLGSLFFIGKPDTIEANSNPEISIFLPSATGNPSSITSFGNKLGVDFASAKWYQDWDGEFESGIARGFHSQGVIPELTWQPQINGSGVSYSQVASGGYDEYINSFARSVASLGFTIRITLAPEMNGAWAPWAANANGNSAEDFNNFWRYTVNSFRANGASNVDWVWSPNVHHYGETASFNSIYPGDGFVDFMGLEGYNWGTSQGWSQWQSFSEVFGSSYNSLVGISGKKILITETASAEAGGNKAQWIIDMFSALRTKYTRIQGFTWFNINKETDWRINSSDASMQAFINAARGDLSPAPSVKNQSGGTSSQNQETQATEGIANAEQGQANTIAATQDPMETPIAKNFIVPAKQVFGATDTKYSQVAGVSLDKARGIKSTALNVVTSKKFQFSLVMVIEMLFLIFFVTLFIPTKKKIMPTQADLYSIKIEDVPFLKARLISTN